MEVAPPSTEKYDVAVMDVEKLDRSSGPNLLQKKAPLEPTQPLAINMSGCDPAPPPPSTSFNSCSRTPTASNWLDGTGREKAKFATLLLRLMLAFPGLPAKPSIVN